MSCLANKTSHTSRRCRCTPPLPPPHPPRCRRAPTPPPPPRALTQRSVWPTKLLIEMVPALAQLRLELREKLSH